MNMWTEDLVLPEELRKERLQKEPASYTAWILGKSGKTQEKKRKAVIICPGGGYEHLSPREGEPPFPEVTAMTIPMEFLLSHQNKSITNLGFVNGFFVIWCEFSVYFVIEFEVWAGYGTDRALTAEPSGSWPTGGDSPSGWGPPFGWG